MGRSYLTISWCFKAPKIGEKKLHFSHRGASLKASWNGQIWPPHLYITCFRTFLDVCSKNNWMVIFTKKFGTLDPPTHSLGQSPKKIRVFFDTFPYVNKEKIHLPPPHSDETICYIQPAKARLGLIMGGRNILPIKKNFVFASGSTWRNLNASN